MGNRAQRLPILFVPITVESSLAACPLHDATGVHCTGLPRNLTPAYEQRQGGDAADVVSRSEFLGFLGIQFRQAHTGFQLFCSLHKSGRHHEAGAAPRRPEIHQHRNVVAVDVLRKITAAQLYGVRIEQGLFALAASGLVAKLGGRYAIHTIAMGADDVQ